ncbi:hypothetical protein Fmac_011198 [Flemingia macrophylla]|uniref:TMEM205-like domain-containing protein n=1 Tax=Flemingia macrophylla TaxID=520843 RepID=A0ABD1MMK5_9FABA
MSFGSQFGNLQSKMFPVYFSLVVACCAVSLASFELRSAFIATNFEVATAVAKILNYATVVAKLLRP